MSRWTARSTVFAGFFAVTAFILALKGLLTSQYACVIGALHVSLTGRAIAEDHFASKQTEEKGDHKL
jgi:hypothetical protein